MRRRHVVVEAAPLVERDHEHRVVQVSRRRQRVVGVGDEPLAEPDVGQRVVIGRRAVPLGVEGRVDETDVRQQALLDRVQERQRGDRDAEPLPVARGERVPEREVLRAPQRQERQVPEEVAAGRDVLGVRDRR
jgi:hypothetical protein